MRNFLTVLKGNLAITAMLLFLALFYALLFYSNKTAAEKAREAASVKTEASVKPEAKPSDEITSKELKAREELLKQRMQKRPRAMALIILSFLFVIASGLLLGLYFCIRKISGDALITPTLPMAAVPWGVREVFFVFVFLFFSESAVFIIEAALSIFFDWKHVPKDLFMMLNSLIRDILVAGLVLLVVTKRYRRPIEELGLTAKNWLGGIRTGLLGYWALVPLLIVILFVIAGLAQLFAYEPAPQPVVQMYLKKSTEPYLIYFTFFVAILGPIIEEVFFRGFAYTAFRQKWGAVRGMLASSAVFALMHMNLVAFFPIFVLGIFLAYLFEKTGSLVPSMTVHMVHNLIMVSLTLGFKSATG
jgi:hypothetical protein